MSKDDRDEVNQAAGTGGGRVSTLTSQRYQQSQGGQYECRVAGPENNTKSQAVCIGDQQTLCMGHSYCARHALHQL